MKEQIKKGNERVLIEETEEEERTPKLKVVLYKRLVQFYIANF